MTLVLNQCFWMSLLLLTVPCGKLQAARPNIVFILVDDLSWSDLACYGNTFHRTPNIDRLASEGMRFTQAYAPAPICSASRAAFLTGKTPARLNFEFVTKHEPGRQEMDVPLQTPAFTLNLPLEETTIGEELRQAGYVTGYFGKWHVNQHYQAYLGWSPDYGPLKQGFDQGTSDFGAHPYAYRTHRGLKDQVVSTGMFPRDVLTEEAIQFMGEHQHERFFLYLSQYFVHDPVHTRCRWLLEEYRRRLPEGSPQIAAAYAAMVETLDNNVGRVLDAINELGIKNETVVVLTSDNGGHPRYTSNAPLRGSKWNLYEGGIRVPFLVRWPKQVLSEATCHHVVHGCDLLPTFCDIAGVSPASAQLDGVSLVPVLKDLQTPLARPQPLIWHFPYYHPEKSFAEAPEAIGVGDFVTSQTRPHSAIRLNDRKLLYFYEDHRLELYDLQQSVAETRDLAGAEPEAAAQLQQILFTSLRDMNARMPETRVP